jgi:hypothetical protein
MFYDELKFSALELEEKMKSTVFKEKYLLCTSLSVLNDFRGLTTSLDMLIKHIRKEGISECNLISTYTTQIDDLLISKFNHFGIIVNKIYKVSLSGSMNYYLFGLNELEDYIIERFNEFELPIIVPCSNIPTMHILEKMSKKGIKLISANSVFIESIRKENSSINV